MTAIRKWTFLNFIPAQSFAWLNLASARARSQSHFDSLSLFFEIEFSSDNHPPLIGMYFRGELFLWRLGSLFKPEGRWSVSKAWPSDWTRKKWSVGMWSAWSNHSFFKTFLTTTLGENSLASYHLCCQPFNNYVQVQRTEHEELACNFVCDYCGKDFITEADFKNHKQTPHSTCQPQISEAQFNISPHISDDYWSHFPPQTVTLHASPRL